jgi:hypothetical protein
MILHSFSIGDVEDPILYAASPLLDWEKSEQGQFAMTHTKTPPVWHCMPDPTSFGSRVIITGEFREAQDETYYKLKYGFPSTYK